MSKPFKRIWMALSMLLLTQACGGMLKQVPERSVPPGAVYDLVLRDVNGKEVDFSKYRGKVLLIDIFTTWSQPAVIDMPVFGSLYRKFSKQDVMVVAIGLDKLGDEVLAPFVMGMQIDFPVLLADKKMKEGKSLFGDVSTIPTLLVFDRAGKLAWVFVGLIERNEVERVIEGLL